MLLTAWSLSNKHRQSAIDQAEKRLYTLHAPPGWTHTLDLQGCPALEEEDREEDEEEESVATFEECS